MKRTSAFALVAVSIIAANTARADSGHAGPEVSADACETGGCYLSLDESFRDASLAYRRLMYRPEPKYLRAAIELATALGVGTAWYWLDRERQVADWDFPSVKERFTFEAWRFDNNPFDINFFWHAFNGTSFHLVARSNRLGLLPSAALGFATSMMWEYALEFREKVSINDVIVTPGSGIAIGEFLHWLGRYLGSAPSGTKRGWRWSLGFWHTVHASIDGRPERSAPLDNLGFTSDIWHRFRFTSGYALSRVDNDASVAEDASFGAQDIALDAALVAIPGYLRPGSFRRSFHEGNVTALTLATTLGNGGFGVDLRADTMLIGHHRQRIPMPETGKTGHALTVGLNLGYHYRRQALDDWVDRFAAVHLPGLAVDGHLIGPRWRLKVSAKLSADFGAINAATYQAWEAANPDVVDKTVLTRHRYYYAFGGSGRLALELSLPRATLGGSTYLGWYNSKEGYDRKQEQVEFDVGAADSYREYEAWLRVAPMGGRMFVGARFLRHQRYGRVETVEATKRLTRYMVELGATL